MVSFQNIGVLRNGGLLFRMALLTFGGIGMLYVRWQIMGTGPPAFTEVDNPASFADSMLVRVSIEPGLLFGCSGSQPVGLSPFPRGPISEILHIR